ncbi:MAG: hypothetical protein M0024_07515 [Nitrospiraceae bacterium]|nr:hypothetical protein [Nitrospiraceae bacterium]
MIRQGFILGAAVLLLLFASWNFYAKAVRHDPYAGAEPLKAAAKAQGGSAAIQDRGRPGWSSVIHEKNLFSPGRTYREPKPEALVAAPVEPPKRPELNLKGIIEDASGEYVAYIEIDKGKPVPLRKGEKTADIQLIDISGRKAVLKWNGEMTELSLDKIKTIANPKAAK